MKINTIIIIFTFLFVNSYAQEYNYHANNFLKNQVLHEINKSDSIVHTGFYPLRVSYVKNITGKGNIMYNKKRDEFTKKMPVSLFWRKLISEDLIEINEKNLTFSLSPIITYYDQKAQDDTNYYGKNTRAFMVKGSLGKKVSFYTDFYETQTYFLPYIEETVKRDVIVPGEGGWKDFGDDLRGKDYNWASGYISFTPNNFLNIQFGHSKHFIGSGYRSVLLSDNSYVYPFAKFSLTKGKFQYTSMFTEFQDYRFIYYFYHYKKHGTFNYLNYSPLPNVEIGLFEGIIWRTSDDSSYVKKFPAMYFLPIPGIREVVYRFNSEQNIILGLNARIGILKHTELYGQFAFDNFKDADFNKRYSYQAGFKIYDALWGLSDNIKLFTQIEYNYSAPYTYTHEIKHQAYTHYNAPLAHTLGAGFEEVVSISRLNIYGFLISYKYNNILTARDTLKTNFGTNLLLSNSTANFNNNSNFVGQGNNTQITYHNLEFAYILNPVTNLQIFATVTKRNYLSEITENELFFVSFGIKNSLNNFYYDY